jgi:hypothetical protein
MLAYDKRAISHTVTLHVASHVLQVDASLLVFKVVLDVERRRDDWSVDPMVLPHSRVPFDEVFLRYLVDAIYLQHVWRETGMFRVIGIHQLCRCIHEESLDVHWVQGSAVLARDDQGAGVRRLTRWVENTSLVVDDSTRAAWVAP